MADTITVKFKVLEDGSLQAIGKNADKAAAGLDKATKSSDKYSKRNKGVAGATSNSTKAFSKMTTGIEGSLVPAYATLAANVFAVTAAFGALRRASAADQLREGLLFTGRAAGQNLTMIAEGLREITGAAVSTTEAMSAVAIGVSAGFSQDQLEGLASVAKGASLALGRDMTDAMDRLIRGAAKLEPEILDELGIMVRLDKATSDFARTLGKTSANELTQFERRMAFTNAIIEQGSNKFLALSNHMKANPFDKLAASFKNLSEGGINFLNNVLGPLASFFADNVAALVGAMTLFGTGVAKQMLPALTGQAEAAKDAAEAQKQLANEEVAGLAKTKGRTKAARTLIRAIEKGEHTTDLFENALKAEAIQLKRNTTLLNNGKITQDQFNTRKEEGAAETARYAAALAAEEQARISGTQVEALALIQGGEMRKGLKLGLEGLREESEEKKKSRQNTKGLTRAKKKLADSLDIGTKRMRLFGAATLRAIPIIGQVILLAGIAKAAFDKFFGRKPQFLDKALEDNKRRMEEFPEVVRQLAETFQLVVDKNEQFVAGLSSSVGLLSQIKQGIADIRAAEEADNIGKLAEAQLKVERLQKVVEERTKGLSAPQQQGELNMSAKDGGTVQDQRQTRLAAAINMLKDAREELSTAEVNFMNSSETATSAAQKQVQQGLITFGNLLKIAEQKENQELIDLNTKQIAALEKAKADFNASISRDTGRAPAEALKKLQEELTAVHAMSASAKNAIDGVSDATSKATDEQTKHNATTGAYAADIDAIKTITDLLDNQTVGKATLNKKYQEALAIYKIEASEEDKLTAQKLTNEGKTQEAEKILYDSRLKALHALRNEMIAIAKDKKQEGVLDQKAANQAQQLVSSGQEVAAAQVLINRLKEVEAQRNKELNMQKRLGRDYTKEELALIKQIAAVQGGISQKYQALAQQASRDLGGGLAGAISGEGKVKAAETAVYEDKKMGDGSTYSAEDQKNDAVDSAKFQALQEGLRGTADEIRKIGPDGELLGSTIQGITDMSAAWKSGFEIMGNASLDMSTRVQAGIAMTMQLVSSLSQMYKAHSDNKIKSIDNEIAAEKARDGASAASVNKIKSLEAKKEQQKRKAFEMEKKAKKAQTIMATAMAVMQAFAQGGPIVGGIMAAFIIAMGAKQLSMIDGQTYDGGGGGGASMPSKITVGSRQSSVDLAKGENAGGELAYARGEQGTGTGMTNFKPAFAGYKHRAAGGFVVGEQGPEVFMPDVPGEIIPSGKGAGAGPANVNFSISAVDSAGVEDLLMNQRGNIIGMIREAANEHGEMFLESVQEKSY